MALHKILKTFKGSQTGAITETFEKGEEREISDYLAACVVPGTIEPVKTKKQGKPEVQNKHTETTGRGGKAK